MVRGYVLFWRLFILFIFCILVFYLFFFGVVGGGIGFRVMLSFKRVFKGFEMVLVEGVRTKVFSRIIVVVL